MPPLPEQPDDQLIDMLRNGNRDASKLIYDRYAEKLIGFAASKLFKLEDAQDVLHDVFARLWQSAKTFKCIAEIAAAMNLPNKRSKTS